MRVWLVNEAGGPDVLTLVHRPDPVPGPGQVHIDIRAFGLNRAEAVTRAGGSGDAVRFPRVLGIECVGTVRSAPGTDLVDGQTVAAFMNGMGRSHDGSYAEQTVVPRSAVVPLETSLPWQQLAAIPETFLTAWGCLHSALEIQRSQAPRIVMRPGASALGRAVNQIVRAAGGSTIGITRSQRKADVLRAAGLDHVIVSSGDVNDEVRSIWPAGATGIIDTVTSSSSIRDDLRMRAKGGRICIAGSLAASDGEDRPGLSVAAAMARPSVTRFSSESLHADNSAQTLQTIVRRVEDGTYDTGIDTVIEFDDLVDAHAGIDANRFCGKVVVSLGSSS